MKLKFNEWLHDGMFENRSYTFFIRENVKSDRQLVVSDPRLVISDPRFKMMDENMSIMFNIEFDHRILQFAKKIASMPTKADAKEKLTHIDDFLKVKNPEVKKAIKNNIPHEVMGRLPSHVSMFPIKNTSINDDHSFKSECEKYIEEFPTIDEIHDKNRDINFYNILEQAAWVAKRGTGSEMETEEITHLMISGEKKITKNPKHEYMNIKFPKVDGTEIFNKFNSGGYDQIIANTIIERNKEKFSPKTTESKWLFSFVGQIKNIIAKQKEPDVKLGKYKLAIAQVQGRDVSAKKDTKDLEDSENLQIAEPLKKQDVGIEKLSKKVEEIISNIKSYDDIPHVNLLNPIEYKSKKADWEKKQRRATLLKEAFNAVTKILDQIKGNLSIFVNKETKKIFNANDIGFKVYNPETGATKNQDGYEGKEIINYNTIKEINILYSAILDKAASELNDESITKYVNVIKSQNKRDRDRGKIIV